MHPFGCPSQRFTVLDHAAGRHSSLDQQSVRVHVEADDFAAADHPAVGEGSGYTATRVAVGADVCAKRDDALILGQEFMRGHGKGGPIF